MSELDLRERVATVDWFHTIDLGEGIVTPGRDDSPAKLQRLNMPADLSGSTVLDIGAWDGFFSFEAERRGASRVLAADCWGEQDCSSKEGFDLARETLGSRVEDLKISVYDVSPSTVGVFDLVIFLGVLYHLKHPLLALERVLEVTGDLLILETHVDLLDCRRPVMLFYPGGELGGDASNWWGPNLPALCTMVSTAGFRRVEVVHVSKREPWVVKAGRAIYNRFTKGYSLYDTQRWGRAVVHAWR